MLAAIDTYVFVRTRHVCSHPPIRSHAHALPVPVLHRAPDRTRAVSACSFDFAVPGQSLRALLAAIGIVILRGSWNECAPPHQPLTARTRSTSVRATEHAFHAFVSTDHSMRRVSFLLWLEQANDLWRSEHLLLEPRTMTSRFGVVGGRKCFRFPHFMCERCVLGW